MAHEVAHIQGVPQIFVSLERQGVQREHFERFAFAQFHFGVCIGCTTTQHTRGVAVEVFQQLAFPSIPDLGAGAANIGHGQQIQGREVALVAHAFGEGLNDVGVAQVLLLRDVAHRQMLCHQEFNQFGIFFVELVIAGKLAHLATAELRVIAPTAFGNVMEQCGGE